MGKPKYFDEMNEFLGYRPIVNNIYEMAVGLHAPAPLAPPSPLAVPSHFSAPSPVNDLFHLEAVASPSS